MSTSSETAWENYHAAAGSWEAWVDAKLAEERERMLGIMTEVVAKIQRDFAQTVLEVRAASRPADGRDGRSLNVRGTWDPGASYFTLDVVACNGASFIARRDNPGVCPEKIGKWLRSKVRAVAPDHKVSEASEARKALRDSAPRRLLVGGSTPARIPSSRFLAMAVPVQCSSCGRCLSKTRTAL
jgi:hypothetical protein